MLARAASAKSSAAFLVPCRTISTAASSTLLLIVSARLPAARVLFINLFNPVNDVNKLANCNAFPIAAQICSGSHESASQKLNWLFSINTDLTLSNIAESDGTNSIKRLNSKSTACISASVNRLIKFDIRCRSSLIVCSAHFASLQSWLVVKNFCAACDIFTSATEVMIAPVASVTKTIVAPVPLPPVTIVITTPAAIIPMGTASFKPFSIFVIFVDAGNLQLFVSSSHVALLHSGQFVNTASAKSSHCV